MIVQVIVWGIKPGHENEVVELCVAEGQRPGWKPKFRMLTPSVSPGNCVVAETEFESLAEMEAHWQWWHALPTSPEFGRKLAALESGIGSRAEVWNVKA
jgi:hypothetical protein